MSKRSFTPRFGHIVTLFLLSAAIEWALETCTFLSQLYEIFLYPAVRPDQELWADPRLKGTSPFEDNAVMHS